MIIKIKCVLITEDEGKTFDIERVDYVTSDVNPNAKVKGKGFRFGEKGFIDGTEITEKLQKKLQYLQKATE